MLHCQFSFCWIVIIVTTKLMFLIKLSKCSEKNVTFASLFIVQNDLYKKLQYLLFKHKLLSV